MDIRQSATHAAYLRSLGWDILHIPSRSGSKNIQVSLLKIPLLQWHFAKIQRYEETPSEAVIRKLFRQKKVFAFSFEPGNLTKDEQKKHEILMKHLGAKIDPSVYVPSSTMLLDLRKPLEELRKTFDANARRLTRPHVHQDVETVILPAPQWSSDTTRLFWEHGKKHNKHWNMTWGIFNKLVFQYGDQAHFAITIEKKTKKWISGILFLSTNDVFNYFQAWAAPLARKKGSHFWTLFKGLEYGKNLGCKTFDFEGLYDPRFPRKSWQGFSHFKSKFGGTVIRFPGCFTGTNLLGPFTW